MISSVSVFLRLKDYLNTSQNKFYKASCLFFYLPLSLPSLIKDIPYYKSLSISLHLSTYFQKFAIIPENFYIDDSSQIMLTAFNLPFINRITTTRRKNMKKSVLIICIMSIVSLVCAYNIELKSGETIKDVDILGKESDKLYIIHNKRIVMINYNDVSAIWSYGVNKKKNWDERDLEVSAELKSKAKNIDFSESGIDDELSNIGKYHIKVNYLNAAFTIGFAVLAYDKFSEAGDYNDLADIYGDLGNDKLKDKMEDQASKATTRGVVFAGVAVVGAFNTFEKVRVQVEPDKVAVTYSIKF